MTSYSGVHRKLIEVALPLPEINDASAYDKMPGIGAHPKGIHQWWARLPLPVARAVLFASVVDDPSGHPERFKTDEAQNAERERLFGILRRLMQKQSHRHLEAYADARVEMLKYCNGELPSLLDPFAGGGSIPLEAARLGLQALASDLNPVAVLLNKCTIEMAPSWTGQPPINPEERSKIGCLEGWGGTSGLATDVRYYGRIIRERARHMIGEMYPLVKLTERMTAERPQLKPHVGKGLPVIAWIWARTVASPDPSAHGARVPLMSTFWLSTHKGKEAWLEPSVDRGTGAWKFSVRTGQPRDRHAVGSGTKRDGGGFRCLLTDAPIPFDYIRSEGVQGRIGSTMVAIVAQFQRGRIYLDPDDEQVRAAESAPLNEFPDTDLPAEALGFRVQNYGIRKHRQVFTPRQLTTMVTLSDLTRAVRYDVQRDALAAGLSEVRARAYATAMVTFLALALDRCADHNSSLCTWNPHDQVIMHQFGRQAIPMTWDFAEGNTMSEGRCSWSVCVERVADCLETISATQCGSARQSDAAVSTDGLGNVLVSTDPPYYDNIGYADLSDFFYVWLRRTIGDLHPELFQTILVPKSSELVAAPERFGGDKQKAKEHFESGFLKAFRVLRDKMDRRFPLTVYYAFKQDDEETVSDGRADVNGNAAVDRTTGWETMLEALMGTGFLITATWPVRASQTWRMRAMGSNALASYIVLACRPRPEDATQTDRRSFVTELKSELPAALRLLQQGNIAPVDFAQAAIGPGMAVYSRHRRILESDGEPMTVRTALALINQMLTEVLSEQEDEFEAYTRWAIAWYEQHGFEEGDFGDAELLSKAKVTSVAGLHQAGLVHSKGGRVRLVRPDELPKDWNPDPNRRPIVWEMTHHLLRVYYSEKAGDVATAELLRKMGSRGDTARDLAYRLYSISEKKNRSQEAQAYNALVLGWSEIARIARETSKPEVTQGRLIEQ